MIRRTGLTILLAIQALGGGAITWAHARDAVVAPPGYEAGHDERCAILHDELRCALCHYASARVVVHHLLLAPVAPVTRQVAPASDVAIAVAAAVHLTAPARAPPLLLA